MSSDPKSKRPRDDDLATGQSYRDSAPYLTLGIQLAATVVIFFLIGWWLDTHNNTSPTYQLVGVLIGSVGGMIKFLKSATELSKKEETSKSDSRED
jgi:F0F1-type ATP synthase assembly protein I